MDENRQLRVTPSESLQQALMKQIVLQFRDTPYVLKGGAALLLTRQLDRHSTDLDFDSGKRLNLESRIRTGIEECGIELLSLKMVKNTHTLQRYKLRYIDPTNGEDTLLKIETSFRQAPRPEMVEIINNIRTYRVSYLLEQKLQATKQRTVARDLYDIAHLVSTYGDQLSPKGLTKVAKFSEDPDNLVSRYEDSFLTDRVLNERTTVEEIVITLSEVLEQLRSDEQVKRTRINKSNQTRPSILLLDDGKGNG